MLIIYKYERKECIVMENGFIYIMTNPALKDMVKIGYAKDVEARRKQLSTTALPYDYEVYATYETSGNLEDKKLHRMIDNLNPDLRVSKNREFFVMTPQEAFELLEAIATISGTGDKLKCIEKNVSQNPVQHIKNPPINFTKCGIPLGAELVFTEDPTVKVTVVSERKVQWNEEVTSLSAIVCALKHKKAIQGSAFCTYNGNLITKIAEETLWKE